MTATTAGAPGEPQRLDPIHLAADEVPRGHPCADPSHYPGDIALLNYLLQDLRVITRKLATGEATAEDHAAMEWDVHGLQRRTVLCDVAALVEATDRHIVGFFGDRRRDANRPHIDNRELAVVSDFRNHPGIISYSSIELIDDQWANLVVHRADADREAWRRSTVHMEAAETLAPAIYHSVRIHNGCILGGPIGSGTVIVEATKYFDYDHDPMWHAVRPLTGGVAEVMVEVE